MYTPEQLMNIIQEFKTITKGKNGDFCLSKCRCRERKENGNSVLEFSQGRVRIRFQKENNGMSVFVCDNPKYDSIVYEQVEMPNKYAQKLYLMATKKFDRQENKAARYTIRKCQNNEPYKSFIKVLTDPNTTLYRPKWAEHKPEFIPDSIKDVLHEGFSMFNPETETLNKDLDLVLNDSNPEHYEIHWDDATGIVKSSTGEKYIVESCLSLRHIHNEQDERIPVPVGIGRYLKGMFDKMYDPRKDVPDTPKLIAQHLKMLKGRIDKSRQYA